MFNHKKLYFALEIKITFLFMWFTVTQSIIQLNKQQAGKRLSIKWSRE